MIGSVIGTVAVWVYSPHGVVDRVELLTAWSCWPRGVVDRVELPPAFEFMENGP